MDAFLISFLKEANHMEHLKELFLSEVLDVDKILFGDHLFVPFKWLSLPILCCLSSKVLSNEGHAHATGTAAGTAELPGGNGEHLNAMSIELLIGTPVTVVGDGNTRSYR